jgi:hypothetical protein
MQLRLRRDCSDYRDFSDWRYWHAVIDEKNSQMEQAEFNA